MFTHTKSSFYGNLQQKITVDVERREHNNLKGEILMTLNPYSLHSTGMHKYINQIWNTFVLQSQFFFYLNKCQLSENNLFN